jgi:hypothetical protein
MLGELRCFDVLHHYVEAVGFAVNAIRNSRPKRGSAGSRARRKHLSAAAHLTFRPDSALAGLVGQR